MSLEDYTPEELDQHAWQIAFEDYQSERILEAIEQENRACYQLRQIGVACENCDQRRFKADLSVPF